MIKTVLLVINDKPFQKRKEKEKKILVFNANLMSLAYYFDLIRGFNDDLWRSFVLFDNT